MPAADRAADKPVACGNHKTIAIVTGTVGSPLLAQSVASVRAQTYPRALLQHWVVVDGAAHADTVHAILSQATASGAPPSVRTRVLVLPENTGGNGYVCHRINGALPWLVSADFVCFLDEDNTFEPAHLEHLVAAVANCPWPARWAHSLRSIVSECGTVVCRDLCESLGSLRHTVLGCSDFLVDTNCYLLETGLARQLSPCWDVRARPGPGRLEADRAVCRTLLDSGLLPAVSKQHSVRYRVGGRADSVQADFFLQGNQVTGYDSAKVDVYLFHISPDWTRQCLDRGASAASPLTEGAPTMWNALKKVLNLVDGYVHAPYIPPHAFVLCVHTRPSLIPLHVMQRADIRRIAVYLDGPPSLKAPPPPNEIALTDDAAYLAAHPLRSTWCPTSIRHVVDVDNPAHRSLCLRRNFGNGTSVYTSAAPLDVLQRYACVLVSAPGDTGLLLDALMVGAAPIVPWPVPPQLDLPANAYFTREQDALDHDQVYDKKVNVVRVREGVLRRCGVKAYARAVLAAMERVSVPPAALT